MRPKMKHFFSQCLIEFIFLLLSDSHSEPKANQTLKLVLIVHRHGDRSPDFRYPNSAYNEDKYWPEGYEMLTKKGKQRMHSLGQYLRQRYKHFLSYNPREVYIRSSGKDRCLESTALVMSGLYPPSGRWKWNSELGRVWQPFPIQTVKYSEDGMLNSHSDCPKAETDYKKISNSKPVKQLMQKYQKLLKFISEKSGLDLDYSSAGNLYNTLDIERTHGYTSPDWVNRSVIQCLHEFHEMIFVFDSSTQLQRRLRAGLLLKDISDRLRQSISGHNSRHRLIVYSTHDTQLALLLNAINAFDRKSILFGATLIFELHETPENGHKLELHYLNVTESEQTFQLSLRDCIDGSKDNVCLLQRFFDSIRKLIPKDWRQECNL